MADYTAEETNMLKSVLLLICMFNLVFASSAWSLFSAGTRIQELFIINMLGHIFSSKTEPYRTGGP
jgi:hypothetical protein